MDVNANRSIVVDVGDHLEVRSDNVVIDIGRKCAHTVDATGDKWNDLTDVDDGKAAIQRRHLRVRNDTRSAELDQRVELHGNSRCAAVTILPAKSGPGSMLLRFLPERRTRQPKPKSRLVTSSRGS